MSIICRYGKHAKTVLYTGRWAVVAASATELQIYKLNGNKEHNFKSIYTASNGIRKFKVKDGVNLPCSSIIEMLNFQLYHAASSELSAFTKNRPHNFYSLESSCSEFSAYISFSHSYNIYYRLCFALNC